MNPMENSVNGTSTFDWVESNPNPCSWSDHDQQLSNIQAPHSELWDSSWCTPNLQYDPSQWTLPPEFSELENLTSLPPELLEQDNLSENWNHSDGTFSSQVGTEYEDASPGSLFTCSSDSSTPEQGYEAEGLVPEEGATVVENTILAISVDIKVAAPGVPVLLPTNLNLSVPGSAACVWSDSACHEHDTRLTPSKAEMNKLFKGVMKKKGSIKWTSETRFAKTLVKVSKLGKGKKKVWLGTFDTRLQAAKALQVGRFLLSENKKLQYPGYFEQAFKSTLIDLKKRLRQQPMDTKLEEKVKKLAKKYSKTGSNCELCFYSVNNIK